MNLVRFFRFLNLTSQQWIVLGTAIVLEVVLGRRAFDLALPFVEALQWVIVVATAVLMAHPIILGHTAIKTVDIAMASALVASAFAVAEFTVVVRVWSFVQLVTAPAIGILVGMGVGKVAQALGRKPIVTVSENV